MIGKKRPIAIVYIILWIIALIIVANYNALDTGSLFFLLCSGGSTIYLLKIIRQNRTRNERLYKKKYIIVEWVIATYFTFALFSRSIFMQEIRIQISIRMLLDFIVLTIVLFPITPGLLIAFNRLSDKKRDNPCNNEGHIKVGLTCGLILLFTDFILTLSYYPCTMTIDSFVHWQQAIGTLAMSDYSPIAFNLLLKGLFTITGFTTPFVFVVFQTAILSAIVGDITAFLHHCGVESKQLIIGSLLFAVIPSTYMLLLYLSKNPLSGILCLGMVVSLLQVIIKPEYYLVKPIWYIKTIVIIAGVYLARENNIVIIVPLIGFVVWFLVFHKEIGKRILTVVGGVAFLIIFMTNIVYKSIEYDHADKSHETVRPLLAPVGSAIQQGLPLPDDVLEVAQKVLPAEEWVNRYSPYNSDTVTWGDPKPQYKKISLKDAFLVYFKMLRLFPDVVIRDRLDGMNLIWDIRAGGILRCPVGLEGDTNFKDAKFPDGIVGDSMHSMKNFATSIHTISTEEQILDMFIWKNGIYIYLLMVTAVYLLQRKRTALLWAVLPSVFILLTYVLVIAWQMYFYIWFFPLSVVLLLIVSIVECGK